MESKAIEQLLEKYLEAETSIQEENELKAYFTSGNVLPHLQEYVPLFSYLQLSKTELYSGKTPAELNSPEAEQEEGRARRSHTRIGGFLERRKVYSWAAVAASIVLMAGIFLQESPSTSEFGSYEDPEVAMEETKRALDMVSKLMNSGNDNLVYLNEFNTTANKLTK